MAHSTCCTPRCRAYTRALDAWLSSAVYAARAQRQYLADKNAHTARMARIRRGHYNTLFGLMLELGLDTDTTDIRLLESGITNGRPESVERIRARLLAENASEGAGD